MENKIRIAIYKHIDNSDIRIKDTNSIFEKMKGGIKYIGNTNHSLVINKKADGLFSFIFNKIKSIFNVKTSIESCKSNMNVDFYAQLNKNTCLCKVRDTNDITLDEFSVMNLFFKLDTDNRKEIINFFVKRNVKTKADLILIDKLFNYHENKKLGRVNLLDFTSVKFCVEDIVNFFNVITLDVNNEINNNVFLFIINHYLKEKGSEFISNLINDVFNSIKHNKYSFKSKRSFFNNGITNKVVKTINIEKFVSEMEINLGIEKVLINKIIDDAFQKYNNADNYAKTQEAWINELYNEKENSKVVYSINKNRILITQKIEEIVNSLDDDEMIIGMPKEQYIIRMEQILDIFSAM